MQGGRREKCERKDGWGVGDGGRGAAMSQCFFVD